MILIPRLFFPVIFIFFSGLAIAQNNFTSFGIQYKPIFATTLIKTDHPSIDNNNVNFDIRQKSGHCFGMVIRKGFKKNLSLETGINYTKRKYDLTISDALLNDHSNFSIIAYEIPLSLLVYIRLGKVYMNASLGTVLDMFPSDVRSNDKYFLHFSYREHLFASGLLANLGYEYRTEKSGYFYLGASLHRPFKDIYRTHIAYYSKPDAPIKTVDADAYQKLTGMYLSVDLRYFFHEDPEKKKARKEKRNQNK